MTRRRLTGMAGDDGAVTATVAIVLGVGVLLGMAAVVVDVGRLYAEREQLQNGADAAAWAVAEGCALVPDSCAEQPQVAQRYADRNAGDGATQVSVVCGSGNGLPDCPAPATNRTACLGEPSPAVRYVEVRVGTELADGTTVLPPVFAGTLADRHAGTPVGACARVAWGPALRARGFAVTFSTCEWTELTEGGTVFWPTPEVGAPPATAERVVWLKNSGGGSTCPAGPSGWDRPGGFGWLDDASDTCEATVEVDGAFGGNTGNSVSQPCRAAMSDARLDRRTVLVPIYDGVRGQGANTVYHLYGFASFVLTGYHLSGFSAASRLSGRHACSGAQRCLYGYFTRGLVPATGARIGGPDLGASIVNLMG